MTCLNVLQQLSVDVIKNVSDHILGLNLDGVAVNTDMHQGF